MNQFKPIDVWIDWGGTGSEPVRLLGRDPETQEMFVLADKSGQVSDVPLYRLVATSDAG